ncbi:DUF3159 domain-containing protein [Cryobacterium tepidiphilum]|uniref:DUF3159 domain-containing protein n=1 Tax=Cryobacterium tepidiphilum TaxID=2486026 RepID=A0A3M8LP63_9MICO|nr:DUF3159 domain-containing protein [Cryobacterium tepidiphilum]RNE66599.1 DUF3159 domain-containing protein [Cryobacterium tepidiphilum]
MSTEPERVPQPDEQPAVPTALGDSLAQAARRAGFGAATDTEPITGHVLLGAMGGIRGIVEAVLPGLVFVVLYTLTRDLVLSLAAPVALGVLFVLARLLQRQPVTPALGGLAGIGISAVLSLITGRAEDFYVTGFLTNAAYALAFLVSAVVGWPLIGLAVGFLMGDGVAWRGDPVKRRVLTILTYCWAGLFLLRLAVELPLYFSGNIAWLGAMKLLMGIPLYAPLLVVSWLVVRSLYRERVTPRVD